MGCEILTRFPKELTISFYLGKSVIQKKIQNENKATFIPRYSNSEENNSRTLIKRYATISRIVFHVEEIISP